MTTQTAAVSGRTPIRRSGRQRLVAKFLRYGVPALISYSLLIAFGLLFGVPFLWLVITSLKPDSQVFTLPLTWVPHPIMWSNYPAALNHAGFPFLKLVRNSLTYAVLSTIGVTLASAMAAYGFARVSFRGRRFWFAVTLGTMMIPGVVTMIPTYIIFRWLNWVGSYRPLIIPSFGGSAFFIFMMRQFMMTLPWEMTDAARVDGASEARILTRIMLPLMKPALLVVVVFNFMACWNDFMGPLIYLQNASLFPLSVGLFSFMTRGERAWHLLMAASLVVTTPIVIIFFLAQRQFIEGITMTGIKG